MALTRRVTTANQQSKFRRAAELQNLRLRHPHMQQTRSERRSCYAVGATLDPRLLDQTFGRRNRPPTPMGGVMSNQYMNDAEQALSQRYSENETRSQHKFRGVRSHTRASALANEYMKTMRSSFNLPSESGNGLFKMTQFKDVKPRVGLYHVNPSSTRRSATE